MQFGKKEQKIDFLRLSLTLFAIAAIVASVLALANYFTAPIIEQSAKKRLDNSLRLLMADAASFEEVSSYPKEIYTDGAKVAVNAIYEAKSADGAVVGYCVRVAPNGYSDVIDMMVAIDKEGAVCGNRILSISDTPGIGQKVKSDEEFRNKVLGLTEKFAIVKKATSPKGEVEVIAGATISSSAYLRGVNAAIDAASQLIREVDS